MGLSTFAPVAYKSDQFEDAEVFGDRWLRDASPVRQCSHRQFAVAAQALEDRSARGIGERCEKFSGRMPLVQAKAPRLREAAIP